MIGEGLPKPPSKDNELSVQCRMMDVEVPDDQNIVIGMLKNKLGSEGRPGCVVHIIHG